MTIELYDHNKETYNRLTKKFKTNNRVGVVQPTGTGKSYLILKWIEDNPGDNILVLSPSNEIFKQLDGDAEKNDLNIDHIKKYTYTKLNLFSEEEIDELHPDKIIMDEFHRAGAEQWGAAINRLLDSNKESNVLGLSATPIRYLDSSRNMADELFDNNLARYMNLGEAVEKGILPVPTYVPVWYDIDNKFDQYQKNIDNMDNEETRKEAQETFNKLKYNLESSYGAEDVFEKFMPNDHGKFIVFCRDETHLYGIMDKFKSWLKKVNTNIRMYVTLSKRDDKEEQVESFVNDNADNYIKLLFSIDRLNEGLHVDDIDGVIMLRPTTSPIIYLQQLGRAFSAKKNKKKPIVFDMVNNYQNVKAINPETGEIENVFEKEIYNSSKNRGTSDPNFLTFTIFEKMIEFNKVLEELESILSVDNDEAWNHKCDLLKEYMTINNGKEPVQKEMYKGETIGIWLSAQKQMFREGKLSKEKIVILESLGVVWNMLEENWNHKCDLLEEYMNINNGKEPINGEKYKGENIGNWLNDQKRMFREGKLSKERIVILESLGVVWNRLEENWNKSCDLLKEYMTINNGKEPKQKEKYKGENIGNWLGAQKDLYRKGKLSKEKIVILESLGVIWNKNEENWNQKCDLLEEYMTINNGKEPVDGEIYKGENIGDWLNKQKGLYRKGRLSKEKIVILESLGVIWNKNEENWNKKCDLLEEYMTINNGKEPERKEKYKGENIGNWLVNQKSLYRKGKLSEERQLKLLSISPSIFDYKK